MRLYSVCVLGLCRVHGFTTTTPTSSLDTIHKNRSDGSESRDPSVMVLASMRSFSYGVCTIVAGKLIYCRILSIVLVYTS